MVLNKDLIIKLDKIKALMSHKNPNMTDQELIEIMAKLVLQKIDPIGKIKRLKLRKEKSINSKFLSTKPIDTKTQANPNELSTHNAAILPTAEVELKKSHTSKILETLPAGPSRDGLGLKNQQPRMSVSPKSRYIPSTLKLEIYMRDKAKCTYPNCNSTHFLEYDHIHPLAFGGKTTLENMRLLCRTHNQRSAINKFGFQKMQKFINR